jgi:hypothetical protein
VQAQHHFCYGPQWRKIVWLFALGFTAVSLALLRVITHGLGAALAIVPLGFALVATLRRLLFPRFIELGQDSLTVCAGFLQTRTRRIAYAEIQEACEAATGKLRVLALKTKAGKIEISSILMPDMASYVLVRDFVTSQIPQPPTPAGPLPPSERGKYCFECSYEGNGEIYDSNGEILWHARTLHRRRFLPYPFGFFRLPDFVVYDQANLELFRVKRERKWPRARFLMVGNGAPICTIRQRSVLLNKYTLEFADGQHWTFRMPLFTVDFGGSSQAGETIRVRLWSHNVWYVFIEPTADRPQLAAALAFIHRERLRCN